MLDRLRWSVYGALALLFLFGAALAVFVYRDLIAPLPEQAGGDAGHRRTTGKNGVTRPAGGGRGARNPQSAHGGKGKAFFTQQKKFAPGSPERCAM